MNKPPKEVEAAAAAKGIDVANVLKVVRPKLGTEAGLGLYRLLRLVALEDIMGRGASGTAYLAGKKLGLSLGLPTLKDFLDLCAALKIGLVEVPIMNDKEIHIDIYECATCAGMDAVGRVICHFEGGLIAGVVESILKKRARATEVKCMGGLGDISCSYDIELKAT